MTDHSPYTVPKEPGRWRAITLAAVVHAALLVFFWIGIDWQSETPVAVKAEIWDMQAKEAAPLPPKPEAEPTPQPKPEPKPVVKETPKAEPVPPPVAKVDIALEKEKKRKEQERKDKLAEEDKEKKQKQKAEQDKLDKLEKQLADKKIEQQKKTDADKKRKQELADAALSEKRHAEEMRRLTGAVGSGGTGQAAKSQGSGRADGAYADKIRAKIRSNTIFIVPDGLSGNPSAEYDVELLPDGSLRGLRLRKSSGLSGFDEAVKRAIERSQPFPPDQSGSVPGRLTVVHKPKDQ